MTNKELELELKRTKLSLHEAEVRINNLEKDSHPPVFSKDSYDELDARLQVIEAFYNNIKLITNEKKEIM